MPVERAAAGLVADGVRPRLRVGGVRQHPAHQARAGAGRLRLGHAGLRGRLRRLDDLVRLVGGRGDHEPVSRGPLGRAPGSWRAGTSRSPTSSASLRCCWLHARHGSPPCRSAHDPQRGVRRRRRAGAPALPAVHPLPERGRRRHDRPAGVARDASTSRRTSAARSRATNCSGGSPHRRSVRSIRPTCERRWLDMFDRSDEMFDLASGLMDDYRVYLLSNIGDLHWSHLDAAYGVATRGPRRDRVVSRRRGQAAAPPSTARRSGVSTSTRRRRCSSTTSQRNVAGARACGWQRHPPLEPARDAPQPAGARRAAAGVVRRGLSDAGDSRLDPAAACCRTCS